MVKQGSRWGTADGKRFHVISVIELEGNTWVHYVSEGTNEPREYSCYLESFLLRFRPEPE